MNNRLIKSNDAGGGCTNTVNLYNPFPDSGGVALYQLNGDATDVSGNYDGTASNVTYGTGQFGQAASFNTSNSVLTAPVAFSTNSPYSVSGWVKIANGSTTQSCKLFWKIVGTNQTALQVFYNGDVGSYYFSVTHKFETNGGFGYSFPANDGQWHHYAMTFDGSNANLYIDGANVKSGALDPKLDVGSTNYIGGTSVYNGVTYYSGLDGVDQVRYFTRALRAYEVEALYTEEYCAPTIVPSEHFNTVLYSGTNASQDISVGFTPDLVWIKGRTYSDFNALTDSVRGDKKWIGSNVSNSEYDYSANTAGISFIEGGFNNDGPDGSLIFNKSGEDYVSWNFKAGGAAVSNTDGTITSQVSANTEAGFSIVSYTGNGVGGATVGHGLGVQPSITIQKNLSNSASWAVLGKVLEDASGGNKRYLLLNTTNAMGGASQAAADSSVIYNWSDSTNNANGNDYIAYCFAEVEGFSKFGSYVGTGTTSGNVVVTGFEPAFVMVKRTDASGGSWLMVDNKRIGTGNEKHELFANTTTAESGGGYDVAFLENGFQMQTTTSNANASGASYIYMAFAADPTTIEPSLEDSFNTVTYTGNGGTQTIGGVFEGGGSFNGSSSYVSGLPTLTNVSSEFSVSLWLKYTTNPSSGFKYVFGGIKEQGAEDSLVGIVVNDSGNIGYFTRGSNSGTVHQIISSADFTNGWHNVVIISDSTNMSLYVDGNNINTLSVSPTITVDNSVLGAINSRGTIEEHFPCSIDQVRIFDTALTAAQVTELYEETDADSHTLDFPSGAGAVALYELNGNANDTGGTYSGTASNVTWLHNGVGFQPDLVWVKGRSSADNHFLNDSVRGAGYTLYSNLTSQETLPSADAAISSFNSNGFTLSSSAGVNRSGSTYVAWNWKGAEIPAINSNGSIPSVVSANPAAGFSIVSYTGNNIAGATIGHGLEAEPDMIIVKNRDTTDIWTVQHSALTYTDYIDLSSTNAATTNTSVWYAQPTAEVFSFGANPRGNGSGNKHIAYCFAEVAGFSKFGTYNGNGTSQTITTGFEPAFVMLKRTNAVGYSWAIADNKRVDGELLANVSDAERIENTPDFISNGFTFTTDRYNGIGEEWIYMAFANQF